MTAPHATLDVRPFLELSPEMACVLDLEGRIYDVNAAWAALLGASIEELRGRLFADLAHELDRGRVSIQLCRLASGEAVKDVEHRFITAEKKPVWVSWSASPRIDDGLLFLAGRVSGDGTVSFRQLRAVIDGTTDFVGLADLNGNISYVNPAGMAMVGRAGQSYVGLSINDVRTAKGAKHSAEVIRPKTLRDGVWTGESEMIGPQKQAVSVWQVFFLLRDEEGAPLAYGTVARDISDKVINEREVRRFKTIAESTSDFFAIAALTGEVKYINEAGLELLGRAGEDPRSLHLRQVFNPDMNDSAREAAKEALATGKTWTGEPRMLRKDGSLVPTSTVIIVLRDHEGHPAEFAIVARDLSSHKRIDDLRTAIRAMSTPLLTVSDGVIALPVVGNVDGERAAQMTEALLDAIVRTRCRVAILDLTGMDVVDTQTVAHLLKMVSAAALLGSHCLISGLSARLAQTIAMLGVDLSALHTFGTLQDALAFADAGARRRESPRSR